MAAVFAFFDLDETIITLKSTVSFQEFWCAETGDAAQWARFRADVTDLRRQGLSREALNRRYYSYFAGRPMAEVRRIAGKWFAHVMATHQPLFHAATVARLRHHQALGQQPVIVSGSFIEAVVPFATHLGIDHILATRLATVDGVCTGEIDGGQFIGAGKAEAIAGFLAAQGGAAALCHAYGDDISDGDMLGAVGHPIAISGSDEMVALAQAQGWPVLTV